MPRIAILPDTLASQVAAGEVVERPASVLKELIENSLDAGASQIDVDIRKGGIALIKVSDNGAGMDKENALLSLERHATSKLQSTEGLAAITTHGFRGEALPSIASVARFKITTNDDAKTPATEISTAGGKICSVEESARAQGTTMEVKDLFFNVPARRKFLKTETTEYAHVEHVIRLSALGNPEIRYTFKNNGRLIWDLKPSSDRRTRIADLTGHSVLKELQSVSPFCLGDVSVEGFLLPGKLSRGTGKSQTVFINGRPVDDPVIRGAIRDGYHGHIQQGQFPVVWLWITMPPDLLDVNVHPAKREVRFVRPTEVKHTLVEAIASTLSTKPRIPLSPPAFIKTALATSSAVELSPPPENTASSEKTHPPNQPLIEAREKEITRSEFSLSEQWATPDQQEMHLKETTPLPSSEPGVERESFSFLGVFKNRYWLMEDENGLVMMDPKAARTRITYDTLKTAYADHALSSQPLLIPLLLELDGHDQNALRAHLDTLNELGVEVNAFGGNTFQVLSLPSLLDISQAGDAEKFILGVIDTLETTTSLKSAQAREKAIEKLLLSIAQQAANQQSTKPELALSLIAELMMCDLPYATPAGQATMIHYSTGEISKKFN